MLLRISISSYRSIICHNKSNIESNIEKLSADDIFTQISL